MADMQDIINSGEMADGNDLRSKTDKAVGRLISRFSGADESRKIAFLYEKNIDGNVLKDILKEAASLREAGNIVLVSKMNKNKKFQKEGLEKQGYTEFKEFYREALK